MLWCRLYGSRPSSYRYILMLTVRPQLWNVMERDFLHAIMVLQRRSHIKVNEAYRKNTNHVNVYTLLAYTLTNSGHTHCIITGTFKLYFENIEYAQNIYALLKFFHQNDPHCRLYDNAKVSFNISIRGGHPTGRFSFSSISVLLWDFFISTLEQIIVLNKYCT